MILVTGGAGFIGANFVLDWLAQHNEPVVNLDSLTYAGNLETLAGLQGNPAHIFVQGDIADAALAQRLLSEHQPRAVVNLAAFGSCWRLLSQLPSCWRFCHGIWLKNRLCGSSPSAGA